jgi:hypothetical protein
MLSKPYVRSLILASLGVIGSLSASPVKADVLVERDSTFFGKITQITESSILIARGCNYRDIKTVLKARVKYVQNDSQCRPHPFTLPTSPLQFCDQPKQALYKIFFTGEDSEIYASDVSLGSDGILRLQLAGGLGSMQGRPDRIKSIVPSQVCPNSVPENVGLPAGFCREPPHMAVNFSRKPVYNNQVFTRGFTFYLDVVGGTDEISADDVSQSFGAALTLWASTLLALRPKLDSELASFVDSAISRSAKYTLFTPPQVIRVDCPENAMMIVKLYKVRDARLFPKNAGYVAKAQPEGRTILLNGVDFKFRSDLDTRTLIKDNRFNLTTIFAHELGHAFGLADMDNAQVKTVMSAANIFDGEAGAPTESDGMSFVNVLKKAVTGSRPGVFEPRECAGLRLPQRKRGIRSIRAKQ